MESEDNLDLLLKMLEEEELLDAMLESDDINAGINDLEIEVQPSNPTVQPVEVSLFSR